VTDKNTNKKSRRQEDNGDSDSTALALPGFNLPSFFSDFMKPFDQFMAPLFPNFGSSLWTESGEREPRIDIQDRGDHYTMTAELPGFEKNDVEVQVANNALELKAEKRANKEDKSDNGTVSQSSYSSFHKYMTLPEAVVSEKVDGTMKNGVLELKLPKKEPKRLDKSTRVALK
jgi:HSP20 family protein